MKLSKTTKHNRTLLASELPERIPLFNGTDSVKNNIRELEISIAYTTEGDFGSSEKAVVLDNLVIPALLDMAANEAAAQADRNTFAKLSAMLETALPGFKGCPAPDDWAKAALRELIEQREALTAKLQACEKLISDANAAFYVEGTRKAMFAVMSKTKSLLNDIRATLQTATQYNSDIDRGERETTPAN